jgi:hypothetical protein
VSPRRSRSGGSSKAQHTAGSRRDDDSGYLMSVAQNKHREVGIALMSAKSATILVPQPSRL